MYPNNDDIFQDKPKFISNSLHPDKGWTTSISGYLAEAKKLSGCLIENKRLHGKPYTWLVTLNIHKTMTPISLKEWVENHWTSITKNLRSQKVVCFWAIEVNKKNKIHYHLLLTSNHTKKELEEIIEKSMPLRGSVGGWHKKVKIIDCKSKRIPYYITKAKIEGITKKGWHSKDLYKKKRVLFVPNLGIKKHGIVGEFWLKSVKKIWTEKKKRAKALADKLENGDVKMVAAFFSDLTGVHLRKVQKTIALEWDLAHVTSIAKGYREDGNEFFVGEVNDAWILKQRVEKKVIDGMQNEDIRSFAKYLYDFVGGGEYTLSKMDRIASMNFESPEQKMWIAQLKLENNEFFSTTSK